MYGEQLESAQYLISKYSKEIEYLNGEYIKGTITVEEYNEKMQDLNDKQWKSVDAYNAAKKAIIELRKKGIDEEIDALEELYDARKKLGSKRKTNTIGKRLFLKMKRISISLKLRLPNYRMIILSLASRNVKSLKMNSKRPKVIGKTHCTTMYMMNVKTSWTRNLTIRRKLLKRL